MYDYDYAIDVEKTVYVYLTLNMQKYAVWLRLDHLTSAEQIPNFLRECWPIFPEDVATKICHVFYVARDELIDRGYLPQDA